MKFGFELEAFCLNLDGTTSLVPDDVPMDECGWLAEIRSDPHEDITKAIYLLKAETKKVEKIANGKRLKLLYVPLLQIDRDLKVQAARKHGKGLINYKNLYGHETHKNATKFATASLHVNFTNEHTWHYKDEKGVPSKHKYSGFVDHAKLIVGLDAAFKEEIKKAKRNPGFYEVKTDGRIEYRSLPNDVSLDKLETVLQELIR